ncbi:MAG: hypothetical protein R6U85_11090 [Salinivirgaceae bacterium]
MQYLLTLLVFILFANGEAHAQKHNPVQPAFTHLAEYGNIRDFSLSKSGNEAYFTIVSPRSDASVIARMVKKAGQWQKPDLASFSGRFRDLEPFLSPDNLRLYFASNRPLELTDTVAKDFDIWFVERNAVGSPWSEPTNLGEPVNSAHDEFYPAVTANGNIYFTVNAFEARKDDIFMAIWNGSSYNRPKSLNDSVNSEGYEFNAYISADEKILIYSGYNRPDGFGGGDLYISYNKNGLWSKAKNLGETINSTHLDYCPFFDASTNTLYFTSQRSSINTKQRYNSLNEFMDEIAKFKNGQSRIYKININL